MKTKITYKNNHYVDQNGNKWNAVIFTRKDAIRLSKSMQNCTNCIDCGSCTNCHECSWCFGLVDKSKYIANLELTYVKMCAESELSSLTAFDRKKLPEDDLEACRIGYAKSTDTKGYVMDGSRVLHHYSHIPTALSGLIFQALTDVELYDAITKKHLRVIPRSHMSFRCRQLSRGVMFKASDVYNNLTTEPLKRQLRLCRSAFASDCEVVPLWDELKISRNVRLFEFKHRNDIVFEFRMIDTSLDVKLKFSERNLDDIENKLEQFFVMFKKHYKIDPERVFDTVYNQ